MKKWYSYFVYGVALIICAQVFCPPSDSGSFRRDTFGSFPVLADGRIKPFETLARNSLLSIAGKQSINFQGKKLDALEWFMEASMQQEKADSISVFPVNNPDLRGFFGWSEDKDKTVSFNDLRSQLSRIDQQCAQIALIEQQDRNAFHRELLKLRNKLILYVRIKNIFVSDSHPEFVTAFAHQDKTLEEDLKRLSQKQDIGQESFGRIMEVPQILKRLSETSYASIIPVNGQDPEGANWMTSAQAFERFLGGESADRVLLNYYSLVASYRDNDVTTFNKTAKAQKDIFTGQFAIATKKIKLEIFYNHSQPFYLAMLLYVLVFISAFISHLIWPDTSFRFIFWLLLGAFLIHSSGLIVRMVLQGRPPVTSLYSSAVFVGWGCILFVLVLEWTYRNGIPSIAGAVIGFVTLLIAQHLSTDGDTLEMLRAVLDTNIWLATHVVTITLGYSATFLAGFLAATALLLGVFRRLSLSLSQTLASMTYGIICFGMLFSLIGTILGGIWADQSWGRFWGWDPKENGALLIVLWHAVILHARWGGMIGSRGLFALAVGGNIITSFSWFGVNMLGVGLHSYGFMESTFVWLIVFVLSQLFVIGCGLTPLFRINLRETNIPWSFK